MYRARGVMGSPSVVLHDSWWWCGWVLNGPQDERLQKGEEIGPFILSSNVVMLFPENSIQLPADWASTGPLKMGKAVSRN